MTRTQRALTDIFVSKLLPGLHHRVVARFQVGRGRAWRCISQGRRIRTGHSGSRRRREVIECARGWPSGCSRGVVSVPCRRAPVIPRRRDAARTSLGPVAGVVVGREMCRHFLLRDASSGKQEAEALVFKGDEAGGLLHLQAGLDTAALIFVEALLEVIDKLLAAGPRKPLVVAVLDRRGRGLDLAGLGVRRGC